MAKQTYLSLEKKIKVKGESFWYGRSVGVTEHNIVHPGFEDEAESDLDS